MGAFSTLSGTALSAAQIRPILEMAEPFLKTACCGGCRAVAVRDHPLDYLAPDLLTCHYFKDGWKDRKDEVLRSIGHL